MFDHLRQQSAEENPPEEEEEAYPPEEYTPALSPGGGMSDRLFGLTPLQRFLIALMLFLNITVLGCFALLAFEKVVLPF
jgi:hypothetical protein